MPALIFFASQEFLTDKGRVLGDLPSRVDTLMPLWPLLRTAAEKKQVSTTLVIAMQAFLLSVLRVQGDSRCTSIQNQTRAMLKMGLEQVQRDLPTLEQSVWSIKGNVEFVRDWMDFANRRATLQPQGTDGHGPEIANAALRQRDQVLFQNPWIAGGQQLVMCMGCGTGAGVTILDCMGQMSFALHLYNGLRLVNAIEPLPFLEALLDRVATSKAVWFAGRPTSNLLKHWMHRMGMGTDTKKEASNRKLANIEAHGFSETYRRAVAADFSDLQMHVGAPLQMVLRSVSDAFESDGMVDINLIALGTHLLPLAEKLVAALDMEAAVQHEIAVSMNEMGSKTSRGAPPRGKAREHAVFSVLLLEILMICERGLKTSDPFILPQRPTNGPMPERKDLPPPIRRPRKTTSERWPRWRKSSRNTSAHCPTCDSVPGQSDDEL